MTLMIALCCILCFMLGFVTCWLLARKARVPWLNGMETNYMNYIPKDKKEYIRIKRFYKENVPALSGVYANRGS